MNANRLRVVLAYVLSLMVMDASTGHAASRIWSSDNVSSNWSATGNWGGATAPGATSGITNPDVATFTNSPGSVGTSSNPVLIDTYLNLLTLMFSNAVGDFVIGTTNGTSIDLSSGGGIQLKNLSNISSVNVTVNAPIVLRGPAYFANDAANPGGNNSGTMTIGGRVSATGGYNLYLQGVNTSAGNIISGNVAGSILLIKRQAGVWTLLGSNTFTGATTVLATSGGALRIGHSHALGDTAGGTTVDSGGALELYNNITVGSESLSLSGSGVTASPGGALRNISGSNNYGGLVTLAAATRINSDSGSLTLSNTGTITGSGFGLSVGGAGDTSIASIIGTGSGTLIKDGAGTLTLSGTSTYTGATIVSNGTLLVTGALNGGGAVTVVSNATLGGTATLSNVVCRAGATLQPAGADTIGTLSLRGNGGSLGLTNVVLQMDVNANSGDKLAVNGDLIFTNCTLRVTDTNLLSNIKEYEVLSWTGTGTISPIFASLPAGWAVVTEANRVILQGRPSGFVLSIR